MSLLLDTTVLVQLLRDDPVAATRVRAEVSPPIVSTISVHEIWVGIRDDERAVVEDLFEWLYLAPVGEAEARVSAGWRRDCAAKGVTLSQADSLIGACALTRGATLATANVKDFPMPELRVEHWSSG